MSEPEVSEQTLGDVALNPDGTWNGLRALSWLSEVLHPGANVTEAEISEMIRQEKERRLADRQADRPALQLDLMQPPANPEDLNDLDPDILKAWCDGMRPAPALTVSQWADEHRVLGKKTSNESGRWRNSRTPYLVEIMDCLSEYHPCTEVWLMKGSQTGGTEAGNNWIGYSIHHSPCPTLIIYPRVDDSKNTSKLRLNSLIEETPAISELIAPARSRDSGNTTLVKEFPGGVLKLVGANSAAGLKSMAARNVFGDEVDEFAADVQGQGDPIELALVRSRTFGATRKAFFVSSPTIKGVSRIERGYNETDRRRYFVPCPHCGGYQYLQWAGVVWDSDDSGLPILDSVRYQCEHCGEGIQEHRKTAMLAAGEWRATAVPEDPDKVGFHLSALYSPVGWYSWRKAVQDFTAARRKQKAGNPEAMKVFINTVLGETWEAQSNAVDHEVLSQRSESIATVPAGGLLITIGVDVQDNRLAAIVTAWGRGEECWILHYDELHGDPDRPEVWAKLDEQVVNRTWQHVTGAELHAVSVAVDSGGHKTQAVYRYARRRSPRVIAIKGQGEEQGKPTTAGRPIIGSPTPQDIDYQGEKITGGVMLWPVGTNTGYGVINSRLQMLEHGPGFIHVPAGQDDEFFKQLASMKETTTFKKGIPRREWVQTHRRREVLHCLIYSYAAAIRAGLTRMNWDQLEQSVAKPRQTQPPQRRRTVSSSFMGG